jgi:hypothetical protein
MNTSRSGFSRATSYLKMEGTRTTRRLALYPTKFFPTRVIDVNYSANTIRLTSSTDILPEGGKYVALSHRWGPPTEHLVFCTGKKDFEERDERIVEIGALPKTFQDAVYITRSLGVSHLWIDSIRTIQDDRDGRNRESQLMEKAFSSANCAIATTRARGFDGGFWKRGAVRDIDQDEEVSLLRYPYSPKPWRRVTLTAILSRKSQKASFLGDSNFSYSAEDYVKGKKIKLIQTLYKRYSNMTLTVSTDRPFAIKGLEARLTHTFGGTGRYGVLQIYFHRCLPWKRSEAPMKSIESFHGETIPSWSWMAYEGGIQYIDAPGSDVDWMPNVTWPPSPENAEEVDMLSVHSQSNHYARMSHELQAPVWGLVDPQEKDMILDDGRPLNPQTAKCVIIGVRKQPAEAKNKLYYLLIVTPVIVDNEEVWKGLGVGMMVPHIVI